MKTLKRGAADILSPPHFTLHVLTHMHQRTDCSGIPPERRIGEGVNREYLSLHYDRQLTRCFTKLTAIVTRSVQKVTWWTGLDRPTPPFCGPKPADPDPDGPATSTYHTDHAGHDRNHHSETMDTEECKRKRV